MKNQRENMLFASKLKKAKADSEIGEWVSAVEQLKELDTAQIKSAEGFLAMESLDQSQAQEFSSILDNWSKSLEDIAQNLGVTHPQNSRVDAAVGAMANASNMRAFFNTPVVVEGQSKGASVFVGMEGLEDATTARQISVGDTMYSLEAYDERDNRNAIAHSVVYNFQAGRQNEFGETFFPTVTVSNDNHGIQVTIRLINVFNDSKHEVTGALYDWQKRNIVKAMIDGTILKNEMTRLIPVFRAGQNQDNFVDNAYLAPYTVVNEGMSITTAPLKVGKRMNIIGLCQTDASLANGTMDFTDTIDPMFEISNIYLKVDNDKFRIPVTGLAQTNFIATGQDLDRVQRLYFTSNSVVVNKLTKQLDGTDLVDLAAIKTSDLAVYLKVTMTGQVNIEQGDLEVYAPEVSVDRIYDTTTGREIDLSTAPAAAIVTLFKTKASIVAFDPLGYLTNANLRNRGQLLTTNEYSQIWSVPLRSPISMVKPTQAPVQDDNANLSGLIAATLTRTSNEAVRTLFKTADMLRNFVDNRIARPESDYMKMPSLFGVARFLLEPTYIEEELDVLALINSIASHEQARDTAAVLVHKVRDIAYRLFMLSGFQAVVDSQAAGVQGMPTVLIGTDITTARYLIIDGESRMAGPSFNYKVVTTSDNTMTNRIFIAFGYPEANNGQLNPMHFGNMFWAPEMVTKLPITRNGQVSNEMIVQPRFRHIVNVPVLGMLKVKNLSLAAVNKIQVNMHSV